MLKSKYGFIVFCILLYFILYTYTLQTIRRLTSSVFSHRTSAGKV
ncbi:hypothetical protein [Pontibacter flavimaris]|nr:hypothetical protein [Pontibacter flavimaris]